MSALDEQIREIVGEHGNLTADAAALGRDADLYAAGMTSHASVGVMLALEDRFGVHFPESMLVPSVFASVASIAAAIGDLRRLSPSA